MSDTILNGDTTDRRRMLVSLAAAFLLHVALVVALALGAGSVIEPAVQPPISIDVQITSAPTGSPASAGTGAGPVSVPSYEPASVPVPRSAGGGAAGSSDFVIPAPRSSPDAPVTTGSSGPAFREAGGRTGAAQSIPSVQEQSNAPSVPAVQSGRGTGSGATTGSGAGQRSGEGVTVKGPSSQGSSGSLDLSQLDRTLSGSGPARAGTGAGSGTGTGSGTGSGSGSGTGTGTRAGGGGGGSGTYSVQWDQPGAAEGRKLVKMVPPQVPAWVGKQGLTLSVRVSFAVATDGVVSSVTIEQSSGYADVDASVTEAIRRWRFSPARTPGTVKGVIPYVIRAE